MATLTGFDATQVEPAKEREPIPNGDYVAIITESTMKKTKNGQGEYLEVVYQLVGEGIYKGRRLWSRHNLVNNNETAVSIAQSELSSICRAVNVLKPNDSLELHNIPLIVKVACRKNKDNDQMTNDVVGWKSKSGSVGTTAPAAAGSAPPWARGKAS